MRDAVAEVLEQRARLSGSPAVAVALSVAAHLGLVVVAATAASRQAPDLIKNVVTIRLAAPPQQRGAASIASAPPASVPAVPKPQPAVEEPAPMPEKPPKRTSEGKSLFGRSELQAPATSSPKAPAGPEQRGDEKSIAPSIAPLPGVGKAGVASLEGGPFPYSFYVDRMVNLIGTRWFRPDVGSELITQVYFVINRDGTVRDVKIEKSSGVASFDRAAFRAVVESSPLPPLPAAYTGTYLGVHLTFH